MPILILLAVCLLGLAGCSTGGVSRGGTLLYGIKQYQGDMQHFSSQPWRWPDRQQVAGSLKSLISSIIGPSPEFARLVDLDLRKREFTITLRESTLGPERRKEMENELVQMDDEIAALKPVVKTQLSAHRLHDHPEAIDAIATLGLLGIAVDGFSPVTAQRAAEAPSTKVGAYLVTDFGSFASVREGNGYPFRCSMFGSIDSGAGVMCEPGK
jgi:hypothetical protein